MNQTISLGDIILVDINGQYEYARVFFMPNPNLIAFETLSGASLSGPVTNFDFHKAHPDTTGYASAKEWLEENVTVGNVQE